MKKLWQSSNIQTSFRDTVSGFSDSAARYVKQNALFTQGKDKEEQQFLRLPLDSARKLRWYDKGDVNQLVKVHARERQDLEDVNDALRDILVESGLPREKVDIEVLHKLSQIDSERASEDGVKAVLFVSLNDELDALKGRCAALENRLDREACSPSFGQDLVKLNLNVEGGRVHVELMFEQKPRSNTKTVVDFENFEEAAEKLISSLQEETSKSAEEDGNGEVSERIQDLTRQLVEISTSLKSTEELRDSLEAARKENSRLETACKEMSSRQKDGRAHQEPSELLAKAQDMCAAAEERARSSQRRAERAELRATKAEHSEREARRDVQDAFTLLEEAGAQSKLKGEQEQAAESECKRLEALVASFETERAEQVLRSQHYESRLADLSTQLEEAQEGLSERDELAFRVTTLEETNRDLKSAAEMSDHYRQLVRELEQSGSKSEENLISTARTVTLMEKKLKASESDSRRFKAKADSLEEKYRKLQESVDAEVTSRMEAASADESRSPGAAQDELDKLQEKLRSQWEALEAAQCKTEEVRADYTQLLKEKEDLFVRVCELEERVAFGDREKTSLVSQVNKQLAACRKELAESRLVVSELESERHDILKSLKTQTSRSSYGALMDSRGSGSFHDVSHGNGDLKRAELTGIDTLYLKNVLFKFIEVTAQGKTKERDALLPAVATVLEASPQEFKALKAALGMASADSKPSILSMQFWGNKK
ncbi:hypothetical protein BSKO_05931 [Bryopsis sp. KO-2023]|nr:hypothetical protein BSKO_05931 [Bryopsis sp. KO-2023]